MYLVNLETFIVCAILIVNRVGLNALTIRNCKRDVASDEMVEVQHKLCADLPCPIKRGTNNSVEFSFVADDDYEKLYHVIYANMSGVKANYPGLSNTNACPFLHPKDNENEPACPLKKGIEYMYKKFMHIIKEAPKIDFLMIHWGLRDRNLKKDALCYEFPVKLV